MNQYDYLADVSNDHLEELYDESLILSYPYPTRFGRDAGPLEPCEEHRLVLLEMQRRGWHRYLNGDYQRVH